MTAKDIFIKAVDILNETKNTGIEILRLENRSMTDDSKGVNVELIFKDGYRRSLGFNEAGYDPNNFNLAIVCDKIKTRPAEVSDDEAVIMKIMCWLYYGVKANRHL